MGSELELDKWFMLISAFNLSNITNMRLGDYEADECYPLFDIIDFFHLYYIPFIIFVGLVGNVLSCVVFLNTHLKARSSSYYLAALATADFGFLASLLFVWLNNNMGVQVFNKDGWCQGLIYVSSVCSFLSVWLIVAFTVERFIAVQYPLRRPQMCTAQRAKIIVCFLTIFALISYLYTFITAGLIKQREGFPPLCDMLEEYREAMRIITIIDTSITLIIPLTLITVMNTMIMRNVFEFGRRFKQNPAMPSNRDSSDINLNELQERRREGSRQQANNQPRVLNSASNCCKPVGMEETVFQQDQATPRGRDPYHFQNPINGREGRGLMSYPATPGPSIEGGRSSSCSNNSNRRRGSLQSFHSSRSNNSRHLQTRSTYMEHVTPSRCIQVRSTSNSRLVTTRVQQNITKMLLLISTVFILLNLPSYVIRLYIFVCFSLRRQQQPVMLWCTQQFFMLLYYTNFSINFLLYSMCGITFRRCLWQLIRKNLKILSRIHCKPLRHG